MIFLSFPMVGLTNGHIKERKGILVRQGAENQLGIFASAPKDATTLINGRFLYVGNDFTIDSIVALQTKTDFVTRYDTHTDLRTRLNLPDAGLYFRFTERHLLQDSSNLVARQAIKVFATRCNNQSADIDTARTDQILFIALFTVTLRT